MFLTQGLCAAGISTNLDLLVSCYEYRRESKLYAAQLELFDEIIKKGEFPNDCVCMYVRGTHLHLLLN